MATKGVIMLSKILFVAGLVSIIASILAWSLASGETAEELAHAAGHICWTSGANISDSLRKIEIGI